MRLLKRLALLAGSVLLFACNQPQEPTAPSVVVRRDSPTLATYIVVLTRTANASAVEHSAVQLGGTLRFQYRYALNGFAAALPSAAVTALRRNPQVESIVLDATVFTTATDQLNPPNWGLDRIDQRYLPLDARYQYAQTGSGVDVYVIDSGIRCTHTEFAGRCLSGYDFVNLDTNADDCYGHGTHVAGILGGTTTGVAKGVRLTSVRVLNCSGAGQTSQVIAGIDWVTQYATPGAVVNMSLSGPGILEVNQAVENSIRTGLTYVVSAGNVDGYSCQYSPAGIPAAFTVASSGINDNRSSFSNKGTCVDIFAPGENILSSGIGGGYETHSGTSMSAPHVSGLVALYRSVYPAAAPVQIIAAIKQQATPGIIVDEFTPDPRLVYSAIAPTLLDVVYVRSLTGSGSGKKTWRATAVHDVGRSGVTVTGYWTGEGYTGCVTGSTGTCVTQSRGQTGTSVTWTITNLSGTGVVWDPLQGPSTVTVSKPVSLR